MSYVVGIDVGGTFTDAFLWDEEKNEVRVSKALSTPADQSIGIWNVLMEARVLLGEIAFIAHGTTVATNAVLERKGAHCALITTKGFRDVIELKRRDRPNLYGMKCSFEPLIPRYRRYEVDERVSAEGGVLKQVSEDEIKAIAEQLIADAVVCVVIGFINSHANPSNERKAVEILRSYWPKGYIIAASDVVNEYREFERISTAVTNAYVVPKVDSYLSSLSDKLVAGGFKGDISVVHSSGGIMSLKVARRYPVRTLLSGPSAGIVVAAYIGSAIGRKNVISCDMGGTSFDTGLIKDGTFGQIPYKELSYGFPLLIPQIDMITIGAGGGSIASIDRGGVLHLGPQSAGADPGPACYGKGGTEATVTDADLSVGHIDKEAPIGRAGELTLNIELAKKAIKERIAIPLGLTVEEAAVAIIKVVNANMAANIRLVSIERGHDPREFSLMAFGGAGPLHANALINELEIPEAIIPPYPGIACAMGGIMIPFQYYFGETINKELDELDFGELEKVLLEQAQTGKKLVEEKAEFVEKIVVDYEAYAHYSRQTHFIRLPLPSPTLSKKEVTEIFNSVYRKERGELVEGVPIHIMYVRTIVTGVRPPVNLDMLASAALTSLEEAKKGTTKVYHEGTWLNCDIYQRPKLPVGAVFYGPAIVEELSATTFVEPGSVAEIDKIGNIIIKRGR